jgi:hypothetical protein
LQLESQVSHYFTQGLAQDRQMLRTHLYPFFMSPLTQEKVMVEKRLAVASGQIVSSLGAELGSSWTAKATPGHISGVKEQESSTAHKHIIAKVC